MKIRIKGRVGTIKRLIKYLTGIEKVDYPESWKFSRDTDYGCVTAEMLTEYVDFSLLKQKSFRGLEVSGEGASYSFKKPSKCSELVVSRKVQPAKIESSQPVAKAKKLTELEEDSEECLAEYDTLELYEAKLQKMSAW